MKWKVLWVPDAGRQLTVIRSSTPNPKAIEDAAIEIDRQLATDPKGVGESRDAGRRILLEGPLAVLYRVLDLSNEVDVLDVWQTKPV